VEAIVNMNSLAGREPFERPSLPGEDQLDLHVDGREFPSLVRMPSLSGDLLEALAEAAHEVYREEAQRQLSSGEVKELPRAARYEYHQLPDDLAELSRGNIRDIPPRLASAGYAMIPARSNEPPLGFPGEDLERLAEMEHARWMTQKAAQGWVYGVERDESAKTSPSLLPWRELSEEERAELAPGVAKALGDGVLPESEKEKDRALVRAIPLILARAGYAVAPVSRR
jgi:RyR domain